MGAFTTALSGIESQASNTLADSLQSLAQTGVGSGNTGAAPIATTAQGAGQNGNPSSGTSIFDLSPSRIAAGVIGIIMIGAGLLMFKTTGVVISTAAKGAAAAAAL